MSYKSDGRGRGANPWNQVVKTSPQKSAEDKFRDAQEKLQAAVQKHLEKNEYDSSSDEEVLESESILTSVFKSYTELNVTQEGVERTRQFLEDTFQSGAGVCLICIASIKRIDPIWNCLECFGYFHLICIQKWSRDSINQQKLIQEEFPNSNRINKINWACPKCRHEYSPNQVPQTYFCFCGKVQDPPYHPWLVPHSCGEKCNKPFLPECGHSCLLLCHPGPCPPCPQTVKSYCHCKKKDPRYKRCSEKLWSCNTKCGKQLICKKHCCEQICHSGECPPCTKEQEQKCQCGLKVRNQPCYNLNWQCDKVCGKEFSCGFHSCTLICHKGVCGDCPLSKSRTCPCGKTSFVLPCTQEVPTCNDTCGKLLDCGVHYCPQKCHKGSCGMCLETVVKVCRCEQHKKELPCQKEFLCETKCKRVKTCGRHSCNRKCCYLECPPCEKPCGRTLKCGQHKCPALCHRGACFPCPQMALVKCRCGSTVISVPCGRQKKTSPPKCDKLCGISPDCHHPSRDPHNCHFGDCPPCKQICGKDRDTCSHKCPSQCHSAVKMMIQEDHRPAGPWEVVEPKMKRCNLQCPDCVVPVAVTCLGGHETSDWPCHRAKPSSCQRPCGRRLKCGNHVCEKPCHVVTGAGDSLTAGENCLECESECLKKRPPGCNHRCPKPCHPGPCPPCGLHLKVKCHCNIMLLYLRCADVTELDEEKRTTTLCCGSQCPKKYPCGHSCSSYCHPGDCPDPSTCRGKVKLSCKCGIVKKDVSCDVAKTPGKNILKCGHLCRLKEYQRLATQIQEEKKRLEEEEKRNREQVEKFNKKFNFTSTQSRKKQHSNLEVEKKPRFQARFLLLSVVPVIAIVVGVLIYLNVN